MLNANFFVPFLTVPLAIYYEWYELSRLTYVFMNNLYKYNASWISLHKSKLQFLFYVKHKKCFYQKKIKI